MPDVGSGNERSKEKETGSRLGEVTPIAGGLHQGPVGPKGRWGKKRKAEVVIRILRGEPLVFLSRASSGDLAPGGVAGQGLGFHGGGAFHKRR